MADAVKFYSSTYTWTQKVQPQPSHQRDSQRARVYKWDRTMHSATWRNKDKLILAECRSLVILACEAFGISHPPHVTDGGRMRVRATGGKDYVKLPEWARIPQVVLHESAHAIIQGTPGSRSWAGHGPEFALVLAQLMDRFTDIPFAQAVKLGLAEGVTFATPTRLLVINPKRSTGVSNVVSS